MAGANVPAHLDPRGRLRIVTQTNIQHRHIRTSLRDPLERLRTARSLPYHRQILLIPQQVTNTPPNQLMVIQQENTYRHATILPHPDR